MVTRCFRDVVEESVVEVASYLGHSGVDDAALVVHMLPSAHGQDKGEAFRRGGIFAQVNKANRTIS